MSVWVELGDCIDAMKRLPALSVDAVVTDPPYGLSFMGKEWDRLDGFRRARNENDAGRDNVFGRTSRTSPEYTSGEKQQEWHRMWAEEAFRVTKPGAHLIAFGGQRTIHRLTSALEDAGWEIRDQLGWQFWSGFPKSLDVSKAIDQMRHDRDQILTVTAWIRQRRDAAGLGNADLDGPFGFVGMAGHWTSRASQPSVPTLDQWPTLLTVLGVASEDVPGEIRRLAVELNGRKGEWGNPRLDRETAEKAGNIYNAARDVSAPGTPVTDDARRWSGFGTALKPSIEPCVLARKPLSESSIARNVLKWGTGALNIDGCRYAPGDSAWPGPQKSWGNRHNFLGSGVGSGVGSEVYGNRAAVSTEDHPDGRFPANVYACPKTSRAERERGCGGLPAKTGDQATGRAEGSAGLDNPRSGAQWTQGVRNHHPTVKPARLMRWLTRLVTPPSGLVLDPFLGSGSTAVAAALEGFRCIGIEREREYAEIATARISHAIRFPDAWADTTPGLDRDEARKQAEAGGERALLETQGQVGMFE